MLAVETFTSHYCEPPHNNPCRRQKSDKLTWVKIYLADTIATQIATYCHRQGETIADCQIMRQNLMGNIYTKSRKEKPDASLSHCRPSKMKGNGAAIAAPKNTTS